jgi:hypothetical protein
MSTLRHDALNDLQPASSSRNQAVRLFSLVFLLIISVTVPGAAYVAAQAENDPASETIEAAASKRVHLPLVSRSSSSPSPSPSPSPAPSPSPSPAPSPSPSGTMVRQAYFYDRPSEDISTVKNRAGLLILERGKTSYLGELKAAGYNGTVLQYLVSNEVLGPGPYANREAACDTSFAPSVVNSVAYLAGDFCKYIHSNEDWFLHNGKGERIYSKNHIGVYYHMNPANPGWRAFAVERMKRDVFGDSTQAKRGYDGIFLDNLHFKIYSFQRQKANADGVVREYATDDAYRRANLGYLELLSRALRPTAKLWANFTDDWDVSHADQLAYLEHLDGYMNEAWALYYAELPPLNATRWDSVLTLAESTLARGKGLLAVVQGSQSDTARQRFGLASYLLISDGRDAFFRYTHYNRYGEWWDYENYGVHLGTPKGPRYQVGNAWRRDFACGYVVADPVARTGQIVQTCK